MFISIRRVDRTCLDTQRVTREGRIMFICAIAINSLTQTFFVISSISRSSPYYSVRAFDKVSSAVRNCSRLELNVVNLTPASWYLHGRPWRSAPGNRRSQSGLRRASKTRKAICQHSSTVTVYKRRGPIYTRGMGLYLEVPESFISYSICSKCFFYEGLERVGIRINPAPL